MIRRRPTRVMAFTAAAVDNCDDAGDENTFDEYDDQNDQKTHIMTSSKSSGTCFCLTRLNVVF